MPCGRESKGLHFPTAETLMAKVKPGGVFASVVGKPQNAADHPSVKAVFVFSKFDRETLEFMRSGARWQAGNPNQPETATQ